MAGALPSLKSSTYMAGTLPIINSLSVNHYGAFNGKAMSILATISFKILLFSPNYNNMIHLLLKLTVMHTL